MRGVGVALALLGATAGCGLAPSTDGAAEEAAAPAPRRVVVMAPAAAEMIEALGLCERVVGIGDFGPWPRAIADRPSLGAYDRPSIEGVLALEADLVLTASSEAAADAHRRLRSFNVRVVALDTSTYEGVFESLARVGRLFRVEHAATTLANRMRAELEAVRSRAAGLASRRVLFVVGRDPLYVAGPGSHVDEMIRMVGGVNVAHDALSPYQQLSLEAVLERMPEVIIDTSDNRPGARRGRDPGEWGRWEFLPAVADDRVYWVDPARLAIPGLRLPAMTRLMGKLVWPERFGEADRSEMLP